jgi:hypothetical protein
LQWLDDDGNTITDLAILQNEELSFRDCLGNIHLLTKDSSFQVYYDYERLQLLYPISRVEIDVRHIPVNYFMPVNYSSSIHLINNC